MYLILFDDSKVPMDFHSKIITENSPKYLQFVVSIKELKNQILNQSEIVLLLLFYLIFSLKM